MIRLEKEKGFLLIEVVIAMVIISIALVAATGMFIQATRANSEASQYTAATTLAQEQLERLKQKPYTFWAAPTFSPNPYTVPLNNTVYTIATTVVTVDEAARLVEVKVEVTWGGTKSVVMTAVYPKIKLPI